MRFSESLLLALPLVVTASPHHKKFVKTEAVSRDNYNHGNSTLFSGFQHAEFTSSLGGHATCISGIIPVSVSAANTLLDFPPGFPANQIEVAQSLLSSITVNSTLRASISSAPKTNVSGTYGIYSRLCYPTGTSPNASLVQLLSHGGGFDIRYWDVYNEEYSYVDAAAKNGYTTFSYSRLGTGFSDHPDPIQIVQPAIEIEILHKFVKLLRSGSLASTAFRHVVGVGHSFGSQISNSVSFTYPNDFDALVLTGFGMDNTDLSLFIAALDVEIASAVDPTRFRGRPNGYLVASRKSGNQFSFLHSSGFAPELLDAADEMKDTLTLGELFTFGAQHVVPAYTGPVLIQLGEYELPTCAGNCYAVGDKAVLGSNWAEVALKSMYPNAKNGGVANIVPDAGHGINFQYTAGVAYSAIFEFIAGSGL